MNATAITHDIGAHDVAEVDMREGAIWAWRFIAGRDPVDEGEIDRCLSNCASPFELRGQLLSILAQKEIETNIPPIRLRPDLSVDMRQGVIWAYRLLLNRNPPNEEAVRHHQFAYADPTSLRTAFVSSDEYRLQPGTRNSENATARSVLAPTPLDDAAIIEQFKPYASEVPPAGFFGDFIGARTRCVFLPPAYMAWSGTVGGPPGSPNGPMHDMPEWSGTLRSVLEAKDQIVVVELGAGWAPWLVGAALAAEKKGIAKHVLIGVEGDEGHIGFARQHFCDNGLDPDKHTLLHAVVGSKDGIATFPRHDDPRNTYGAEADYGARNRAGDMVSVRCVSMETLLKGIPKVDLVHCDIQGAEAEVLSSARQLLDRRVRRIVIGTHAREVEGALHSLFASMGWRLEHDSSCAMSQTSSGQVILAADGTQVWSNPKLASRVG